MVRTGVDHIAVLTHDPARLGAFYAAVFDAEIGPTRPHDDVGSAYSMFFRDPDGLEGEVLVPKAAAADRSGEDAP